MRIYFHDASKTDDACCGNCFYALFINGIIACVLEENEHETELESVCKHWSRQD